MIRLVVCDVDGTLVKDGGSASALNPEYYEVVRKLSEKGIQVVICSGRQKASIEKLFEPVKDLLYIISEGGSLIFQKEECIYSQILQKEVCRQIIDDARKIEPCDILVCGKKHAYATSEDSEMYRWISDSYGFDIQAVGDLQKNISDDIVKIPVSSQYGRTTDKRLVPPKWKIKEIKSCRYSRFDCVPKKREKEQRLLFYRGICR
ncbi:MAG: HAD family hydrolase [Eubacterium sp.]